MSTQEIGRSTLDVLTDVRLNVPMTTTINYPRLGASFNPFDQRQPIVWWFQGLARRYDVTDPNLAERLELGSRVWPLLHFGSPAIGATR